MNRERVRVQVKFGGKVRQTEPMSFEDAVAVWAMTDDLPTRIVREDGTPYAPARVEGLPDDARPWTSFERLDD